MKEEDLKYLKHLCASDFSAGCEWAENNIPSLKYYFDTWSSHCGAKRSVFIGHTIKMLISI